MRPERPRRRPAERAPCEIPGEPAIVGVDPGTDQLDMRRGRHYSREHAIEHIARHFAVLVPQANRAQELSIPIRVQRPRGAFAPL
jgi:hypothetical protein